MTSAPVAFAVAVDVAVDVAPATPSADGGIVAWLTGLPSSGKSTLARATAARLRSAGLAVALLDGDELRAALRPEPGYGAAERDAFYETLARVAALLARQGLVVLVAATAHRQAFRDRARALAPAFLEVFVDTPPEVCRRRDAKGLYARSAGGGALELPGAQVPYERPARPDFALALGADSGAGAGAGADGGARAGAGAGPEKTDETVLAEAADALAELVRARVATNAVAVAVPVAPAP